MLPRPSLILKTPGLMAMSLAMLGSPVITIFAPSLKTQQASTVIRSLTVPTLNTTTDAVQNDVYLACVCRPGLMHLPLIHSRAF